MNSYLFHLIELDDYTLLFDGRTYAILKLDAAASAYFRAIRDDPSNDDHDPSDSLSAEITVLIDSGALSVAEKQICCQRQFRKMIMLLTDACELRCKYCFEKKAACHNGTMSYRVAKQCIEYLMKYSQSDTVEIECFGGEPLLAQELLKYIVRTAKYLARAHHKTVSFSIITNGVSISKDLAKYLKRHKFKIQVSIDGNKKAHDMNRIFANGGGSYNLACEGLQFLKNEDADCGVFTVVTRRLLCSPNEWLKNMYALGNGAFDFCIVGGSNAEQAPFRDHIEKCMSDYRDLLGELSNEYNNPTHSITSVLAYQEMITGHHARTTGCGAGTEHMVVMPNGDIDLCHRISARTSFNIGDNAHPSKILHGHARTSNHPECDSCWAKYLCGGGCAYNSAMFSDGEKPAWWECEKNKAEIEAAIKIVYKQLIPRCKDHV